MKTLLALAALSLTLAGCGTTAAPTVTVTASETVTQAVPAPQSPGEEIRDLLSSQGFPYSGPSSDLEEVAETICEAIDSGIEPETLVRLAMDSGFSMEEGAALVAASIVVVCPHNRSAV